MGTTITASTCELKALVINGTVITADHLSAEEIRAAMANLFGHAAHTEKQDTRSAHPGAENSARR